VAWVFVDDDDTKKALADVYRANALPYLGLPKPDYGEGDIRNQRMELVSE
jgi:hypothetical protein